ncbi:hypothetical protein GYMLUDRAFT_47937 [Collybiopsis luxurians FD-317 M1]|uniref:Extracellular membrane protein CFEM domain-containing protein n=1 Tax=Collybiopsis luxurians FD-317 M1 TaxID=944289 RepID=A0A0D0CBG3_9AGAR|nr:hypothetical protein GYMLUDRAFT_47937 [Collybiopsis luxurians FD-317 M1]
MHRAFSVFLQIACFLFFARISAGLNSDHGPFRMISARQDLSDVPAQCQSTCNQSLGALLQGGPCFANQTVCCTNTFVQNLANCYECVENLSGTPDDTLPQSSVNETIAQCALVGINITEPTFNPSFSGSSSSDQSTATAVTPLTQGTLTDVPSSTTPVGANTSSPVSTSASSNGGFPGRTWSWAAITGLIGASWALGLMA